MRKIISKYIVIGAMGIMGAQPVLAEPVSSIVEYPTLIMLVSQAGEAVSAYETLHNSGILMNNILGGFKKSVSPVLAAAGRIAGENYNVLQKMPTSVKGLALAQMTPEQASAAMTGMFILDKTVSYTDSKLKEIRQNRIAAANDTAISSVAYAMGNEAAIKKEQETDEIVAQAMANATDMQALFRTLTAVDRQTLAVSLQETSIESTSGAVKAMRAMNVVENNSTAPTDEEAFLDKALSATGSGMNAVGGAATSGLNAVSSTMGGISQGVGSLVQGAQDVVSGGTKAATDWVVDSFNSSDEEAKTE